MADIPVTLTIGPKQKLRHVKREASLWEVQTVMTEVVGKSPESWHFELNDKPLEKWSDAVKFFDEQKCEKLKLEVKNGPLPVKCGNGAKPSKDSVMIRISFGKRTKARRLPKTLSTSELRSTVTGIFPEITGEEYHLEYWDGVWLEDGNDWKSMQEHLKSIECSNGRIDLKLVRHNTSVAISNPEMKQALAVVQEQTAAQSKVSLGTNEVTGKASDFIQDLLCKPIPKAIRNGNYRGGLQECLMKNPKTRSYKLNFDTKNLNPKNVCFQTRGTLEVEKMLSLTAFGSGPSKRASVQNCAKQFLEKLRIIPSAEEGPAQRPAQNPAQRPSQNNRNRILGRPHLENVKKGVQNIYYDRDFRNSHSPRRMDREFIWSEIKRILTDTRVSIDVVAIRNSFRGRKGSLPTFPELNAVLYEQLRKGMLRISNNKKGRPCWSKPFINRCSSLRGRPCWSNLSRGRGFKRVE